VSHPAADAVQVEERQARELFGGPVAGEPARGLLGEHALGDKVAEDGVQGVRVAAGRGGEVGDAGVAGRDVLGEAKRGGYAQAPGRGQVQHPFEVYHRWNALRSSWPQPPGPFGSYPDSRRG